MGNTDKLARQRKTPFGFQLHFPLHILLYLSRSNHFCCICIKSGLCLIQFVGLALGPQLLKSDIYVGQILMRAALNLGGSSDMLFEEGDGGVDIEPCPFGGRAIAWQWSTLLIT